MSTVNRQLVESLPEGAYVAFVTPVSRKDWGHMVLAVNKVTDGNWDANNVSRVGEFRATKDELLKVASLPKVGVLRPIPANDVPAITAMQRKHIVGMQPLV